MLFAKYATESKGSCYSIPENAGTVHRPIFYKLGELSPLATVTFHLTVR